MDTYYEVWIVQPPLSSNDIHIRMDCIGENLSANEALECVNEQLAEGIPEEDIEIIEYYQMSDEVSLAYLKACV